MSMNPFPGAFNSRALFEKFQAMTEEMQGAAKEMRPVDEVERRLWSQLLEIGHQALEEFFAQCGDGDEGAEVKLPDGHVVKRLPKPHTRAYLSIFGAFELERTVYGTCEGQRIEYVPLDRRLNLPESKFSYVLQDWDQSQIVETPYTKVNETLVKIPGLSQSVDSMERMNRKLSENVEEFWKDLSSPPPEKEGSIVVCTADGKGVPIRGAPKEPLIQGAQFDKDPKPDRKKVALVGGVYTIGPFIRTPEEVLDALYRVPGEDAEKPPVRPKPLHKHIRVSLLRDQAGTSLPSYDEIFGWMAGEVIERSRGSKTVVSLMDGQDSLWKRRKQSLPDTEVVEILDLLHALSYLWKATHLFYAKGSTEADDFVYDRAYRILCGEIQSVIRGLRRMGSLRNLRGKKREKLQGICRYFKNNQHRMRYDEYLAAGYPIASGVIEGACRNVVKDRMERSGMRWVLQGAHAMLGLRTIHLCGLWDKFMDFHIRKESKRLYPRELTPVNDPINFPLAA